MPQFIITTLDSSTLCLDTGDSNDDAIISTTNDLYNTVTSHTNIPCHKYILCDNNHHTLLYHDSSDGFSDLLSLHFPCINNGSSYDDYDDSFDMTADESCIIFLRMTIPIIGGIDFQHREGSKIGSGISYL